MSEKLQIALLQLAGFAAVLIGCGLAMAVYAYMPALAALAIPLTTAIGWYVGKLVAQPLSAVTMQAVDALPAAATAELVTRIATSSPPLKIAAVLQSLAPAAREQIQQHIQIILDDEAASFRPPPPPPRVSPPPPPPVDK